MVVIRKANGQTERFSARKIIGTCLRAGLNIAEAKDIVRQVEKKLYKGISTREILSLVVADIHKIDSRLASIYTLKDAIVRLGPDGFVFEEFIVRLLQNYGFQAERPDLIQGECVLHEVDIAAIESKGGAKINYMVECKYHNNAGYYSGVKSALYTWARFEDLQNGFQLKKNRNKFDQPWLVTNTKFSDQVIEYSKCKGIRLLGWRYPEQEGLEVIIEKLKLYPLTILKQVEGELKDRLVKQGIIFCQDFFKYSPEALARKTSLKLDMVKRFFNQAKNILQK